MTRGLFVNRRGGAPEAKLGEIAGRGMERFTVFLVIVLALAAIGGGLFLAFRDFPAPSVPFEKVLPDARFPK